MVFYYGSPSQLMQELNQNQRFFFQTWPPSCDNPRSFRHTNAWVGIAQVALVVKNPPANAGDIRGEGSTPGSERSPGGGHDNPLQYSCLENPTGRGAWWAKVYRVAKSRTQLKRLSTHARGKVNDSTLHFLPSSPRSAPEQRCQRKHRTLSCI